MTVRPIVIAGDPVLHNPTELVDLSAGVTPELRTLIADMVDTPVSYTHLTLPTKA